MTPIRKRLSIVGCFLMMAGLSLPSVARAQLGEYKNEVTPDATFYTYYRFLNVQITPSRLTKSDRKRTYRLATDESNRGNAAIYYYRACLKWNEMSVEARQRLQRDIHDWLDSEIDQLPLEEIKPLLAQSQPMLKQLEHGSRLKTCDWGVDFDQMDFASFIFHDLSELATIRGIARVNCLRARVAIAEGDLEGATRLMQQNFKLALDVAQMPVVTTGIVAEAIVIMTLRLSLEMGAVPNSPNQLHALRSLPRPIVDFLPKIKSEQQMIERKFELLRNPETAQRSQEQWRQVFTDATTQFDRIYESMESEPPGNQRQRTALIMARLYPLAKRELIRSGWDPDRVEKMPVGQVVAIQTRHVWDELAGTLIELENLPSLEATRLRNRQYKELMSNGYGHPSARGDFPISDFTYPLLDHRFIPSHGKILNRQIAMMQNLERLRDYAADHGELPASDQYDQLEMLRDPLNGKAFVYERLSSHSATLDTAFTINPKRPKHRGATVRMEIQLKASE